MAHGQTCYFPDGAKATGGAPCQNHSPSSDGASPCCKSADAYLKSYLCLEYFDDSIINRQSCMDTSFSSLKISSS